MNGPPSSGQDVIAGRRSSRTSRVTRSVTGPERHAPHADLEQLAADVARAPQLRRRRRQQRLGQLDEPPDEAQRPLAERQLGPPRRAEQIGDEAEVGALDVGEEQRRTAGGDHAPVDFRDLEVRIDRGVDRDDRRVTVEAVDERLEDRESSITLMVVGARTVDVRHLRSHRAQVRRQLAAVVDAVVVGEADELRARHLHHAEEVERLVRLVGRHRAQRLQLVGNVFL